MTRAKRGRKFNPFQCLHRRLTTSKKLGECLHNSDRKTLLFSTLMKNPLMFGIYQVSKIKFSCPVILISGNPVKPAGSCCGSGRCLHLHIFYQIHERKEWEAQKSFRRRWCFNQTLKKFDISKGISSL